MGRKTTFLRNGVQDHYMGSVELVRPASLYAALFAADKWTQRTASLGDYCVPTSFPTIPRVFKCTTGGATGAVEPTWVQTDGATTTDSAAVWTEQSLAFDAGTIPEAAGGGYARVATLNNLTNFPAAVAGVKHNGVALTFPTGQAGGYSAGRQMVGFAWFDLAVGGNASVWGTLAVAKPVLESDPASFAISAFTWTETA